MSSRSLLVSMISFGIFAGVFSLRAAFSDDDQLLSMWIGCDGTVVNRTEVGKITITHTKKNLPNCMGPKAAMATLSGSTGAVLSQEKGSLDMFADDVAEPRKFDKPLFDLSQKDIINYRIEQMSEQEKIQYTNAVRSLRIREGKSKQTTTNGYLMKNDTVQVTGPQTGWTPVRSGEVKVTDARENTVDIDTTHGISGYVGTRFLRDATPSDLVKIGQADIAYWADIVHTNVAYMVNVRSHPWFTAPIVTTVTNNTRFYRVSTVDNWSEVQSVDGNIHGYIRSDFLVVDVAQMIEKKPVLR